MKNSKTVFYPDRQRKIIDFCIGFLGLPALYWLSFSLLPIFKVDTPQLRDILYMAAALGPLVALLAYGAKRRYAVIGALCLFGAAILVIFGSCVLLLGG